jgi:ParB family chromosome partitioning protein
MEGLLDVLDSIAIGSNKDSKSKNGRIAEIEVNKILPSNFQPRRNFDEKEILNLAGSIQNNGLINPITVRDSKEKGKFEIIAGERRYRAVMILGWLAVPVIIKELDDKSAQAIALVENLQREDLNPIEEASGYVELLDKHGLTHDQVAEFVGKPRSTISNLIRLLELQAPVKDLLKKKSIDVGHAKLLVSLSSQIQIDLAEKVVVNNLSVRQLEALIKKTLFTPGKTKIKATRVTEERFNDLALYLKRRMGGDFEVEISNVSTSKFIFSDEESYDKFVEFVIKI